MNFKRALIFWKSASAGAIIKNWGAVRKCVRNKYWSADVRAAHSKFSSNPTSGKNRLKMFYLRKIFDLRKILLFPKASLNRKFTVIATQKFIIRSKSLLLSRSQNLSCLSLFSSMPPVCMIKLNLMQPK